MSRYQQEDILRIAKDEQIKGRPGIAKGIEYGRQNIIHEQKGKTQEIDLQIKHGIGKNILRRVQSGQDRPVPQ